MLATVTPVNGTSILAATDFTTTGGGGAIQIFSILLGLAALGAGIYTAIDANKYSDEAHTAAGAPKMLWVIGGPVGGVISLCCCFVVGLILPILWFAVYKKKVEAAQGGGFGFGGPPPPPGGFGGPPPGGGYQPPPRWHQPPPPVVATRRPRPLPAVASRPRPGSSTRLSTI